MKIKRKALTLSEYVRRKEDEENRIARLNEIASPRPPRPHIDITAGLGAGGLGLL